jgi:GNAT superfamily N-acetyltransferase
VTVRRLVADEIEVVDSRLPLHRLDREDGFYLVAWEEDEPVGHVYLALTQPPELADVWVAPDARRRGVARALTQAAEREARSRGFDQLTLTVSVANETAQLVYQNLGYVQSGAPPRRVAGTLLIRGAPVDVDDLVLTLTKPLEAAGVDSARPPEITTRESAG